MMKELEILQAVPIDEPDRSKIKWPKRKWVRPKTKTRFKPKSPQHPGTTKAREVLERANRNLTFCEQCGGNHIIQIHHKDGNPYNNKLENLRILCKSCHMSKQHPLPFGVIDEAYTVPYAEEDY